MSLDTDDRYAYRPLADRNRGGQLWAGESVSEDEWRVTLAVANEGLGWPTIRFEHTLAWFGMGGMYLVGGEGPEGTPLNAVWHSMDGAAWEGRCGTSCFAAGKNSHSAVSHNGSLWVIGGQNDDSFYRSRDGVVWETVGIDRSGLPFEYGYHEAVSYHGTLWIVGGRVGNDPKADNRANDIYFYSETDGRFVLVNVGTPPPRTDTHEVVAFNGRLWLFDGTAVWVSDDGFNWGRDDNAAVPTRDDGAAVAMHAGSLYHHGDSQVWRSADGYDWELAGASPADRGGRPFCFVCRQFVDCRRVVFGAGGLAVGGWRGVGVGDGCAGVRDAELWGAGGA